MSEPFFMSFDTETTGTDPETARIVSATIAVLDYGGDVLELREWLIDPGIEIPDEATAVHGITTDDARTRGLPTGVGIWQIFHDLMSLHTGSPDEDGKPTRRQLPLVIMNAPYDLTLLDREVARHAGHGMLWSMNEAEGELERNDWLWSVVDPLVLDKRIDRYRRGKRTLTALAEHYRVPFDGNAHGSTADATAAGRIALELITSDELAQFGPRQLHHLQTGWYAEQMQSLADYFRTSGTGDPAGVFTEWPIREAPAS